MKKFLEIWKILIIILSSLILFAGCGNSDKKTAENTAKVQQKVENLKQQVAKIKDKQNGVVEEKKTEEKKMEVKKEEKKPEEKKPVEANSITLDSPKDGVTIKKDPVTLSGTISAGVTKISVIENGDKEPYFLQNYKPGDLKFSYNAKLKLKNLKVGLNTYEFTAYFKDGSTKSAKVNFNFSK